MNYSITQNGKELDESLYTIDEENKTFSSKEDNLVLDFTSLCGWSFKTGTHCVFTTGSNCVFMTGACCLFNTDWGCVFKTSWGCTYNTDENCTILSWDAPRYLSFIIKEVGTYEVKKGKLIKK